MIGHIDKKISDFGPSTIFYVEGTKIRGTRKTIEYLKGVKDTFYKDAIRVSIYDKVLDQFLFLGKQDKTGFGIISHY